MFQRTKICTGLLLAFGSVAAFAQDATPAVQRVEITGSSIKRVDTETSLPIQTVSRKEIDTMGITSTEQLLAHISANSAVGAVNAAANAGAATYGLSTASLRGLGSQRTLVLVNGRRLANYATDGTSVDINSIPIAAVDRVEILKDGASGVYGSDAVAGVINFILRKDFKGVELSGYYGQPTASGGGKSSKASIVAGFGDYDTDHYSLMASLDLGHDTAIYGSQRKYANRAWDNNGLFEVSATPSGALTSYVPGATPGAPLAGGQGLGNPLGYTITNPETGVSTVLAADNCAANGSGFDNNANACRFNSSPYVPLVPDVTRQNLSLNFRGRVNDNNAFFAEAFVAHQRSVVTEQFSPYSNSFLSTDGLFQTKGINPSIVINPTNPAYPAAYLAALDAWHLANPAHDDNGNLIPWTPVSGKAVSTSYRAYDGGPRVHTDDSTLYHFTTGFEGTVKGWDYDAAYSHNDSEVKETTQNGYQNQTALVALLSGNDQFNPYVMHQTPALAAQIAATNYNGPIITNSLTTDSVDAKASGELFQLPGGAMMAAVGVSFRKEQLTQTPSAAYSTGDVSGYGGNILPLDVSRNSRSVFAEIDAPILKSLEADVSVRNDHYPNASSTNPKVSLRFQPISQALFRGSFGTGFREPSLPELYNQQTIGTSTSFKDPAHPTDSANQYPVVSGGNPELKPEKSKQFSFGTVLQPIKNLSASVDFWHIKVDKEVTTLDPEFIVKEAFANNPTYTGLVTRVDGNITKIISTNINVGGVQTSGVDVDVSWKSDPTTAGLFGLDLNGTWTHKYDETLPDGTVQPSVGNTIGPNGAPLNAVSGTGGGIIFKWRHTLTGTWTYGPVTLALSQNYQSKYNDNARADCSTKVECATPVRIKAFSTYDLQGAYTGVKNLTFRLGVKNLADRKPPQTVMLGQYFQVGYDPTYYDPHGRFVYTSATYKF